MKIIIPKVLLQKKILVPLVVLLILATAAASYLFIGIQQNVQKMAAASETPLYSPNYPEINTKASNLDVIKRGEYLAKAGDCLACHTNAPEKGKAFAGGLAMPTPFGTIYSPNITPDPETGIGKWTEAEFIKAMREGISPEGHYYYPAFPYYYFNKTSIDDLKAIKAYLDNIPPIKQKNRDNDMLVPFNIRLLQLGWRILFFRDLGVNVFEADPKHSADWNRGAYLVEGLGHCAMCHSPSYHLISNDLPLGAPIQKYELTGAKVQGYLAPNISKTNLADIPEEEIIKVFTEDKRIGGGKIEGPMLEVNHDSLRYLSHADLFSIATYLKSVDSVLPPRPKGSAAGKGIYEMYCATCHVSGAGGAPKYGDAAAWDPILKNGMEKVYSNAINGIGGMPAKGTCLSCKDDEIKLAVDYLVASVIGKKVTPIAPAPKKLTMADGKRIYDANCSVCHVSGFKGAPIPGDMQRWKPIIKAGFLETFINVETGKKGHLPHGACPTCSDGELKAAIKYMMQQSTTDKNYNLW